jgi:hypothetical protein
MAEIIRVDYENMVCDLAFLQGDTPRAEEVPLSSAYWSKRGFLGAMPEEGSICIVGFSAAHLDQATKPFILSFLPNGYKTGLRFDPFGAFPRDADGLELPTDVAQTEMEGIFGPLRHKFRKIYPGDIFAMSSKGSEIILDSGVKLFDRGGGEFLLRDSDSSAILTAQDYYLTTNASRFRSGKITRNALNTPTDFLNEEGLLTQGHPLFDIFVDMGLIFEDGTPVPDVNSLPSVILEDGRKISPITKWGNDPNEVFTEFYNENRTEIQEFSTGVQPISDAHGFDVDSLVDENTFKPFIEKVSGTVVGNDPYSLEGRPNYGRLLKPVLFSSSTDTKGVPRLEPVDNVEDEEEARLVGASLYRMHRPDGLGELFLAHDKEGHVYLSIPASTSKKSNLGAGRSLEANLEGSAKIVMGANQEDNLSFDLHTEGGLRWSLGSSTLANRSMDVKTLGGVNLKVLRPDVNGDAFKISAKGNVVVASDGTFSQSSTGDSLERVQGRKSVSAESVSLSVGIGNFTTNVMSSYDLIVKDEYNEKIGSGKDTKILRGGSSTTIFKGDHKTTLHSPSTYGISFTVSGTHEITSQASLSMKRGAATNASYDFEAPTGSYTVSLNTGTIKLVAGSGVVNVSTSSVTIKGPQIHLEGKVGLGSGAMATNAVIGGVSGPSPHLDYITGAPLRGNSKVKTV